MKSHPSSPSPSTSSSSSLRSTISSLSLSSSSSSSSATASASASASQRCQGLDLLVKAVYHVAGSVIGVPYIQRRVIRRRKPALRFDNLLISPDSQVEELVVVKKVTKPTRPSIHQPKDFSTTRIIKRRRRRSSIPAA